MKSYRNYRFWMLIVGLCLLLPVFTQAGSLLPGDANADGTVDLLDLTILGDNYGVQTGAVFSDGDFNGDGAVDLLDLTMLGENYGKSASQVTEEVPVEENEQQPPIVPLPSSVLAGLLMLGTLGTVHIVRHRRQQSIK